MLSSRQPAEDRGPSKNELKKKAKAEEKEKKKAEKAALQAAAAKQREDANVVSVSLTRLHDSYACFIDTPGFCH
jgi:hypothetical protein